MSLYWPIFLVVISNVFYHICAKSAPKSVNPLIVVMLSYAVGTIISLLLYFLGNRPSNILQEVKNVNWAVFVFGIAIIGLEIGNINMYRVGWNVNTGYMVQSAIFAVALLLVGYLMFKEPITFNKIIGTVLCLAGLYFIRK